MIEEFAKLIPETLMDISGRVFYSGRQAFESQSDLYILGINPGGDHAVYSEATVRRHTEAVLTKFDANWSAYRDESWGGARPGAKGIQPSLLRLFEGLGRDPGEVPASNLVFVRSKDEEQLNNLYKNQSEINSACWPFHQSVIEKLGVSVLVCFGGRSSAWACRQLKAKREIDTFTNGGGWTSRTFRNAHGLIVVALTFPNRGRQWTVLGNDPSRLVVRAIELASRRR